MNHCAVFKAEATRLCRTGVSSQLAAFLTRGAAIAF